jgi:hypothetical protein
LKPPDDKIDASMRAFARRWMNSIDKPRPSTSLGYFFVGLFTLFWASSLTNLLGFDLRKGWGSLVFIGLAVLIILPVIIIVRLMARIGLDRPIRSAFLFSAVIGPYVDLVADHAWNLSVVSHMLGFAASILAFLASLLLDRLLARSAKQPGQA